MPDSAPNPLLPGRPSALRPGPNGHRKGSPLLQGTPDGGTSKSYFLRLGAFASSPPGSVSCYLGPPAVLSFPELSALLLWRFITSGALTHYPLRLCEAPVSQSGSPRLLGGPHVGRSRGLTPRPPASAGPGALVPECRHQSRPNEKDPQGRTP